MAETRIVWWCEKHDLPSTDMECNLNGMGHRACQPSQYRLAPSDALVVEKVDGEWPEWALNVSSGTDIGSILDALASGEELTGDCEIDCQDGCAYPGQFTECELGAASGESPKESE
ncbi:MAG TPA: hypothetical protein VIG24_04900 [Acidimicrobiia bacterium]